MSPAYNKNISIIVAIAENNAIGKNNELLWKISDDLKRFKKLTTGHKVIMGRNTYLSLPNSPLPNRKNVVITDIENEKFEGCEMAYSIEEALANVQENEEAFVIGGGMIYKQFLPHANKLYLTRVHQSF
ncbi:MAG: dihydrofolate reductase, partial [Bacteroidota bacterium]